MPDTLTLSQGNVNSTIHLITVGTVDDKFAPREPLLKGEGGYRLVVTGVTVPGVGGQGIHIAVNWGLT
jgi:hypothetical protein